MWGILICVALIGGVWLSETVAERKRIKNLPRCPVHFYLLPCPYCEIDALRLQKLTDEQIRSSVGREYWSIPTEDRERLRALAEDHIKANHIPTTAGSIEAAVVNMWRRSKRARMDQANDKVEG